MEKIVFGVFDSKAGYFKHTFMLRSKGEALRQFSDIANDKNTEIGKHPEDFVMFKLADFDEIKGEYKNNIAESLGIAIEFVNKE